MKQLITVEKAKTLVSGSEERKEELIGLVNSNIEEQAAKGLRWAHLPTSASEIERKWLEDELIINGFTIKNGHPAIGW